MTKHSTLGSAFNLKITADQEFLSQYRPFFADQSITTQDFEAFRALPADAQTQGVLVVGAGIVGVALAASLLKEGFKVILLERASLNPSEHKSFGPQGNGADFRLYAVNYHNYEFLKDLNLLSPDYNPQHYSFLKMFSKEEEKPQLKGSVSYFKADTLKLPYLGVFAFNDDLVKGGLKRLQEDYPESFILLDGTAVEEAKFFSNPISVANNDKVKSEQSYWQIKLSNQVTLYSTVVLAVDGGNSFFRNAARIALDTHDYPTKCMMVTVKTPLASAEERSELMKTTSQLMDIHGPKAWLPFEEGDDYVYGNLVWYDQPATIDRLTALPLPQLKAELLANFPPSIFLSNEDKEQVLFPVNQEMEVLQAGSFPLARKRALQYCQHNVMLFGDAAHTVIPLAGQGLNIGLTDVRFFAEQFAKMTQASKDYSLDELFSTYHKVRYADNTMMQEFLTLVHNNYVRANPLQRAISRGMENLSQVPAFHRVALAYASGDRTLYNSLASSAFEVRNLVQNFTKK